MCDRLPGTEGRIKRQGIAVIVELEGKGEIDLIDVTRPDIVQQAFEFLAVGADVEGGTKSPNRPGRGFGCKECVYLSSGHLRLGLEDAELEQRRGASVVNATRPAFEGSVQLIGKIAGGMVSLCQMRLDDLDTGISWH